MAARLEPDESPRKGLRRIVRAQIEEALAGLSRVGGGGPAKVVHDARKRFKRVRALLRLAQEGLDDDLFEREKARFRDAGRPLSEVRDAGVLVATFDDLVERAGDAGRPREVEAARAMLVDRERDAAGRVLGDGSMLPRLAGSIEEARDALRDRAFAGVDWPALRAGLRRIYRRGRRAMRDAGESPTDENLHEWRKRVKDLWHALDVLDAVNPRFVGRRSKLAHDLADALGDDHDLAVLRGVIAGSDADFLTAAIDRRREELRGSAFALGRKLYRRRPRALVDRLDAEWHAWRSGARAR